MTPGAAQCNCCLTTHGGRTGDHEVNTRTIAIAALVIAVIILLFLIL